MEWRWLMIASPVLERPAGDQWISAHPAPAWWSVEIVAETGFNWLQDVWLSGWEVFTGLGVMATDKITFFTVGLSFRFFVFHSFASGCKELQSWLKTDFKRIILQLETISLLDMIVYWCFIPSKKTKQMFICFCPLKWLD